MKKIVTFLLLLGCIQYGIAQKPGAAGNDCKDRWECFDLRDTIRGQVLFPINPGVDCGMFAVASLTVIKTSINDTIRVLELCNKNKKF